MNRLGALLLLFATLLGCTPSSGSTTTSGGGQGGSSTIVSTGSSSSGAPGCADATGCAADQYCAWANEVCHLRTDGDRDDQPGACAARDEHCGDAGDTGGPVCGCDGKTYESRCAANTAGIDVQNEGGCTPPAGMFGCGFAFCQVGESYCQGFLGDGNDSSADRYQCLSAPTGCSPATCDCLPTTQFDCTCTTTPEGGAVQACAAQ